MSSAKSILRRAFLSAVLVSWLPSIAAAAPPTPSPITAACDATVGTQCWVNGPFDLNTTSAGAHHFRVCRSNDTLSWGGCNHTITFNAQMPYTVGSADIASDGFRRAYYVAACDASSSCTSWSATSPKYVYTDTTPSSTPGPSMVANCAVGATGPSGCWVPGNFTVSVTPATDSGSGVGNYRVCRGQNSTGGFSGCSIDMSFTSGTSFAVSGSNLPSEGFRRSYYFKAQDRVGNWGGWNSPIHVRVDSRNPRVSATNASSSWETSQTATIDAGDDLGGVSANSGLKEIRYRWNTPLNGGCTNGTVTTSGATLNVPAGDNTLYLCARDFTGRVGSWQGTYRVDGSAPTPGSFSNSDTVWVIDNGSEYSFTAQADDSISGVREIRALINFLGSNNSNRRGLFSWRDASLSYNWSEDQVACAGGGFGSKFGGAYFPASIQLKSCSTSLSGNRRTVTFTVEPKAAFGEFSAINDIATWTRDFALNPTGWINQNVNFRTRLADDSPIPTVEPAAVSSSNWIVNRTQDYRITTITKDLGSGVREIRATINRHGENSANPRGFFSWRDASLGYLWSKNQIPCTGGGWASMHHKNYGATRTTLVGCETTLIEGVEREVIFTVRPNETFGAFTNNDISVRAWDFGLNRSAWTHFDLDFTSIRPGDHKADMFGYAGITNQASLAQSVAEGIPVDVGTLLYLRKQYVCNTACRNDPTQCVDSPQYWKNVDTAGILAAYSGQNAKAMLVLENVLFRNLADDDGDDCQPDPQPHTSPCFQMQRWVLQSDWQQRLDEFVAIHGSHFTPQNIAFILMTSEINDRCMDPAEVEMAAIAVQAKFPNIPLGMIYGATHDKDGQLASQPAPLSFPPVFDVVGMFSYDTFDMNNPLDTRNAPDEHFYNPENPNDSSTVYGDLLNKLHPHQEVMLLFDADFQTAATMAALGWVPEDLGTVLENYAEFMSYRPEVSILAGFHWLSFLGLPQSVKDTSKVVACEKVNNESPLCP